jgi:hypothetical protein
MPFVLNSSSYSELQESDFEMKSRVFHDVSLVSQKSLDKNDKSAELMPNPRDSGIKWRNRLIIFLCALLIIIPFIEHILLSLSFKMV